VALRTRLVMTASPTGTSTSMEHSRTRLVQKLLVAREAAAAMEALLVVDKTVAPEVDTARVHASWRTTSYPPRFTEAAGRETSGLLCVPGWRLTGVPAMT
jgi:hypothetical protein